MDRSTWLSAAKWTTAVNPCRVEKLGEQSGVGDVAVDKGVACVAVEVGKRGAVARVGEFVQVDDARQRITCERVAHEVRADEAGSAGDEKNFADHNEWKQTRLNLSAD